MGRAGKDGYSESFEWLAIFAGDLTGNDTFGHKLEKSGRAVRSKLQKDLRWSPCAQVIAEVAGLFCFEGGGAGGESFKLEFAFGVGERSTGRRSSSKPHKGMRN